MIYIDLKLNIKIDATDDLQVGETVQSAHSTPLLTQHPEFFALYYSSAIIIRIESQTEYPKN